jgi:hypothetical protein
MPNDFGIDVLEPPPPISQQSFRERRLWHDDFRRNDLAQGTVDPRHANSVILTLGPTTTMRAMPSAYASTLLLRSKGGLSVQSV